MTYTCCCHARVTGRRREGLSVFIIFILFLMIQITAAPPLQLKSVNTLFSCRIKGVFTPPPSVWLQRFRIINDFSSTIVVGGVWTEIHSPRTPPYVTNKGGTLTDTPTRDISTGGKGVELGEPVVWDNELNGMKVFTPTLVLPYESFELLMVIDEVETLVQVCVEAVVYVRYSFDTHTHTQQTHTHKQQRKKDMGNESNDSYYYLNFPVIITHPILTQFLPLYTHKHTHTHLHTYPPPETHTNTHTHNPVCSPYELADESSSIYSNFSVIQTHTHTHTHTHKHT
eukprot:GHVR01109482.1.p1 GENE.GHVR01109482.1~~GHVR01109482.1.p1  ORF type:complete len:284 (+),score=120.40 GHVR01109482.1:166-1017(+)